jgi:hypothetical protein
MEKTLPAVTWLKLDSRRYTGPKVAPDPLHPSQGRGVFLGRDGSIPVNVSVERGELVFSSQKPFSQRLRESIKHMAPDVVRMFQRRPGRYTLVDIQRLLSN